MRLRRKTRMGNHLHRQTRGLRLEPLESRTLLSASPTDDSFRLAIFSDSDEDVIPAEVGVETDDSTESLFTLDTSGEIYMKSPTGNELGDFFDIWQNNAGKAGNKADAVLTEDQLLGNIEAGKKTVQMFVNGQVSTEFEDYDIQDGDEIVLVYGDNPVLSINTNYGPIVVELFADQTPKTAANFLNYVNDDDYLNSFFHRSVEGFVIQGGGFTTDSTTFTDTDQFSDVPSDAAVENEPGISNLRGTLAMAKLGGDPDSATNQYFVNLTNDHATAGAKLDTQNGGFTVFGQVLDMTTADEIADLTITPASSIDTTISANDASLYSALPLGTNDQLAVVQSLTGQGTLSGIKYLDENKDGNYDSGEDLLAGVTIYLDANNNGVLDSGETWTVTGTDGSYFLQVEAGSHTLRSEITPGRVGTEPLAPEKYTVDVEIGRETTDLNFGEINLPAPSGIDLIAGSDTGSADDDNITRRNNTDQASTMQFLVSGVTAGAEVQIFDGTTMIGSAVATDSTVTVTTDGSHTLTDGTHSITAVQALGGTTDPTDPLVITIDTTPPSGLTNQVPDTAQVGVAYSFDASSPEEGNVAYSLANAPSGMTIDSSTGEIAWTPTTQQAEPQSFDIVITDDAGNAISENYSLTVLGTIPAYPDEYSVLEDTTLTIDAANGVLKNDDTNSGTLTVATIDLPSHGNLTLNSNGSFSYTPHADYYGTDTFTYQATNSNSEESNVAEVTITVTPADDPPVGVADTYTVNEDTTLTRTAATGVLANDTDPEDDDLTAALVDQADHGTVTLSANGSFTYVPDANYAGADSFTYKVSDGTTQSEAITVSLTLTAVNDAPTTAADAYTVDEDGTLTVSTADGVLKNDSDVDSSDFSAMIQSEPTHGDVTLDADGSFVYTPDADFFGTDSFTYKATDGDATSGATTVTITVNGKPDDPTATNDTFTAPNDGTAVLIDVIANDTSAPDGSQTLTITDTSQGSAGGTVAIEGNKLKYTAKEGTTGTETITYTITDSDGLTDTATVTVTVADASDNTISGFVYIDADGDGTRDSGEVGVPGVLVTLTGTDNFGNAVNRTALTSDDGSYTFETLSSGTYQLTERQPLALADGEDSSGVANAVVADDVISNIEVSDSGVFDENNFGEAGLLSQYISIKFFFASAPPVAECLRDMVAQAEALAGNDDLAEAIRNGDTSFDNADNETPVAANDAFSVDEDGTLTIVASSGVLTNDTDSDGGTLSATLVNDVDHGTLTLNADGSFTYKPDEDYHGTDSFTYLATDGYANSTAATVTITVEPINDVPVAQDDSYDAVNSTTLTVSTADGVLDNDSDDDDDTLTASVVSDVSHGTLTLNSNGSFTYQPDSGYSGTDTFTYKANDGTADSSTATVTITVSAAPVAAADSYSVDEDKTLTVVAADGVLDNDTDADGDTLTAVIVSQPTHGAVTLKSDGSFIYAPNADFHGTDTFTYKANDGTHDSEAATVTITVNSINDVPVAGNDSYDIEVDGTLTVAADEGLLDNDTDADDDTLTAVVITPPVHGTLTLNNDGSFTYEPDTGYHGTDTFTYKANDGTVDSASATVTINVNAIPVVVDDTYSVDEDGTLTKDAATGVLANDTDADNDTLTVTVVDQPAHGTLNLNANGSFTYTPDADYHGTDTFTYKANDGTHDSEAATVTITVNSVNDVPVAVDDSYDIEVDGTLTVAADLGVLDNDTDADNDTLTAVVVTQPSHGTLTLNDDGSFTYEPDTGYYGSDTFTYRANDGTADSAVATVTIDVNAIPVVENDTYSVDEDGTLTKDAATGVLANDIDADNDNLTVTVVDQPTHGTLTLNANGSFTYTPDADYHGTDTFTYKANDGTDDSEVATVTITVNSVNDAPVAEADSYSVPVNGQLSVNAAHGVLANDSDADGDSFTATVVTQPTHGTLTLNADGTFSYTPDADYHGTDTFAYRINDGTTDSANATATIDVNTPANAVDDSYSTSMNSQLSVDAATGVLANDTDANDDSLSVTVVTQPSHGSLALNTDGSFVYTPTSGYHGDDSFTYTVDDGYGASAEATATINVNAVPTVVDDAYSLDEDGTLTKDATAGVLNNDSDADSDTLTVTVVTDPVHGTVSLNSDGSFSYTPDANYHGTDSFAYKANDGTIDSSNATVTITINSVADDPEAADDSYTVVPNGTLSVSEAEGVLANDSDGDDETLTATVVDQPSNGTLTLNANGSFSYEPSQDFHGTDTFTYKANDGSTDSQPATVTINVNSAPSAVSDSYSVNEDTELTVDASAGVLNNDTDPENDTLTAAVVMQPSHGTLTLNADGSFSYTPEADYAGDDAFSYKASDGLNESVETTVVITIAPVNDAPVTADDAYSVPTNGTLTVDAATGVRANDTDADGDSLTVTVASGPSNGQLTLNADGSFTYTPNTDFHGTDTFNYTVNDGTVDSAAATVTIDVNTLAAVTNDTYSVAEDGALTIDAAAGVLNNDSDVDGDSMTVVLVTGPAHGTVTLDADGSFEYTPNDNFHGTDSFIYTVNDGYDASAEATATITVSPVNDAPEVADDSYPVLPDGVLKLNAASGVLENDSDVDGDSLDVTLVTGPAHGTLLIDADGAFQYTPDADYEGTDSFTYQVNDGTVDSLVASVSLNVDTQAALADQAFAEEQDWA